MYYYLNAVYLVVSFCLRCVLTATSNDTELVKVSSDSTALVAGYGGVEVFELNNDEQDEFLTIPRWNLFCAQHDGYSQVYLVLFATTNQLNPSSSNTDVKKAATTLGYTQKLWDSDSDEASIEEYDWADLSAEQKAAAVVLGYDMASWDK